MSLDELPPQVAHRRELEAWEDRSIPAQDLSNADLMRRQKADDLEALRVKYEERDRCESVEATEAYWRGVFAQMPDHVRDAWYREERLGIDHRMMGP